MVSQIYITVLFGFLFGLISHAQNSAQVQQMISNQIPINTQSTLPSANPLQQSQPPSEGYLPPPAGTEPQAQMPGVILPGLNAPSSGAMDPSIRKPRDIPAPPAEQPTTYILPKSTYIITPKPKAFDPKKVKTQDTVASPQTAIMSVPTQLDLSLGQFEINGQACQLNFAYSSQMIDLFTGLPSGKEILLSSVSLPAKKFKSSQTLVSSVSKESCWFHMELATNNGMNKFMASIPGQEAVTFSGPLQPFLRQQIDTNAEITAGTIIFKTPLEMGPVQLTGQFSFRTQYRNLGETLFASFQKNIKADTTQLASIQKAALENDGRSIASTNPESAALPQYALMNKTRTEALLITEGTLENDKKGFSLAHFTQKEGQWMKQSDKWVETLPTWIKPKPSQ